MDSNINDTSVGDGNNRFTKEVCGMAEYRAVDFVYRPPSHDGPKVLDACVGFKFAQGTRLLDYWGFQLKFLTRGERFIFRLKHPIVYSKRGLRKIYLRIRRLFISDRMIQCLRMRLPGDK